MVAGWLIGIVLSAAAAWSGELRPTSGSDRAVVVNPDGSGDAQTLQAGIDTLFARRAKGSPDTILVMPGFYDEVVNLVEPLGPPIYIVASGGAGVTRVRDVTSLPPGPYSSGMWIWDGISVEEPVDLGTRSRIADWEHCRFESGFVSNVGSTCYRPNLFACELSGDVELMGYSTPYTFDSLHFVGATLRAQPGCGSLVFSACRFEGTSLDTAVIAMPLTDDAVYFEDCTFSGYGVAVTTEPVPHCGAGVQLRRCVFKDIADAAVACSVPADCGTHPEFLSLGATDCRFERCGQAIRWVGGPRYASLERDTVFDSVGDGVELEVGGAAIDGLVVHGSGGAGLSMEVLYRKSGAGAYYPLQVTQSEFTGNAGPGLSIQDTTTLKVYIPLQVESSTFSRNGGAGLHVRSHDVHLFGNLAHTNGGDGIAFERVGESFEDSVALNTSARNDSAGVRFAVSPGSASGGTTIANNLVAFNAGEGLVGPATEASAIARNDSWSNLGAEYAGFAPGPTNLTSDPQLCGVASANYAVRNTSPCAPTGPYGQIGAFGVGCNSSTVDVENPPAIAFALRSIAPNPARGIASIRFALTGREPARLDLYDIAGRVRWSREVGALGAGEHQVELVTGRRLPAGIYLVTLSSGSRRLAGRLALLD